MRIAADGRMGGWADRGALLALLVLSAYPPNRLPAQDTLPIGFGTLKRDDIVLRFDTPELEIQLLPLRTCCARSEPRSTTWRGAPARSDRSSPW